jgi:hypothetical protein
MSRWYFGADTTPVTFSGWHLWLRGVKGRGTLRKESQSDVVSNWRISGQHRVWCSWRLSSAYDEPEAVTEL